MIGKDKKDKSKPKSVKSVLTILLFFTLIILINNAAAASLIKVYPRIENITIEPRFGYWYDTFNISFDCRYFKNATIELEIYDLSKHNWVKINKSYHTDPTGNAKKMSWLVKVCSGECSGNVKFRVLCDGEVISEYMGPEVLTTVASVFKNATVSPQVGYYDYQFNYSVEVPLQINKANLSLLVFDISLDRFKEYKYNSTYCIDYCSNSTSKVYWKLLNVFSKDYSGLAKFKFKYVDKFGVVHYSETYYGPILKSYKEVVYASGGGGGGGTTRVKDLIVFTNASVWYDKNNNNQQDPGEVAIGTYKTNFTFSVESNADKLILLVFDISSNIWKSYDEKFIGYNKVGNKFLWKNISVSEVDAKGLSKFKFIGYKSGQKEESQVFFGPYIERFVDEEWVKLIKPSKKPLEKPKIKLNVSPVTGGTQRYFEDYKFTITINHPNRANMSVLLFVYKPSTGIWRLVEYSKYNPALVVRSSDYNSSNIAVKHWIGTVFDKDDVNKEKYMCKIWYYDGWNLEKGDNETFYFSKEIYPVNNSVPMVNATIFPKVGYFDSDFGLRVRYADNDTEDIIFIKLNYMKLNERGEIVYDEKTRKFNINRPQGNEDLSKDFNLKLIPNRNVFFNYLAKNNLTELNLSYYIEYWDLGMEIEGLTPIKTGVKHIIIRPYNIYIERSMVNGETENISVNYYDPLVFKFFLSEPVNVTYAKLCIYLPSKGKYFNITSFSQKADTITFSLKRTPFVPTDVGKISTYHLEWKHEHSPKMLKESGKEIKIKRSINVLRDPFTFTSLILFSSSGTLKLLEVIFRKIRKKFGGEVKWS